MNIRNTHALVCMSAAALIAGMNYSRFAPQIALAPPDDPSPIDVKTLAEQIKADHKKAVDEDARALRSHYIRHWGVLFVAGKRFVFDPGAAEQEFDLLIPGPYTVESPVPVRIDGVVRRPHAHVRLDTGRHTITADGASARVALRWGSSLPRPEQRAPERRIFRGFRYR